ncbi:MAG: type II toxin-antitoxin system RelE/ParE family toxin [Janthinobacterium lividum]
MAPALSRTLSVYKGKAFMRFAKKARIADYDLWQAAQRANDGLVDADLGGGVIKQRIARAGEGKSGGSRSIILFKLNNRAVYVYGFEKKDAANIDRREVEAFRELAEVILGYSDVEIEQRVSDGALFKVEEPGENNA